MIFVATAQKGDSKKLFNFIFQTFYSELLLFYLNISLRKKIPEGLIKYQSIYLSTYLSIHPKDTFIQYEVFICYIFTKRNCCKYFNQLLLFLHILLFDLILGSM